jgi:DNA adenine methylase
VQFNSPLRYPGGKGRLTQFVADLLVANGLVGGHYVEPCAGGAAIGVSLLLLEYVSRIYINDINPSIYAFWNAVINETDSLCKRISDTRVTLAEWKRQRKVQSDESATPLDKAFSTFFLNRTNRSGIICGGVIGGDKQTGNWKLDARFNKLDLTKRIEKIANRGHRITLSCMDAGTLISSVLPSLSSRGFVYLDPPYYGKGKGLYEDFYTHEDHARIADLVGTIQQRWIVSYDNVSAIRRLYRGYRQKSFALMYSAQNRYEGSEVMIFSDRLRIPRYIRTSRGIAA